MASFTPNRGYTPNALGMAVTSTASRKRKREDEKSVLGGSFVIKPHSSSVFDSLVKLTPAVALPRSYIPLQWLTGYPSRLFSITTHLPVLDTPGNVLVVKVEGERQLAAVERIKDGVYTLYKLSTQLKMKDVRKTFAQVKRFCQNSESLSSVDFSSNMLGSEWWSSLVVSDLSIENSYVPEPTFKLAIGSSDLGNTDGRSLSLSPPVNTLPSPSVAANNDLEKPEIFSEPTLTDILEKTGMQYFKTLYIAKTSLAYFAKSTLSRARVAVQQENTIPSSPSPGSELCAFLLGMHLPFDKMDIKYRKSIPQIAVEDQVEDMSVFRPGEEEYVQQWRFATWQERLVQTNDPTLKRKVEELKIRETELQIIILLEVLALEREQATSAIGVTNENLPSPKKRPKCVNRKKGKQKSKISVPDSKLLLDLLVDRLCIWRSIGSGSTGLEEESSGQKKVTDREHDHLRHFCVEVVLAFYASRLPEECASINKKCGGSNPRRGIDSPNHTKAKKDKLSIRKPNLLRSVVAPAAAPGAREASVDTLTALVAADARGIVRGGTLNSKSFAKREVQISSRSGQQKKVEDELKAVINVLKKPNRVAVASELVDESAKRLSKKLMKPTRNPLTKVQVMATPKRRRAPLPTHQHLFSVPEGKNEPSLHNLPYVPHIQDLGAQHDIPGTPLRQNNPLQRSDSAPSTSPFEPVKNQRPSIFCPIPGGLVTPQKKSRRSMGIDLESGNFPLPTTKIQETLLRPFPQPVIPSGIPKFMLQNPFGSLDGPSSPSDRVRVFDSNAVSETPSKPAAAPAVPELTIEGKKELSIYNSLGWDDDYDL